MRALARMVMNFHMSKRTPLALKRGRLYHRLWNWAFDRLTRN